MIGVGADETRFLDEQVANREIDRVAAPFDTDGEHVIIHEFPVEDELDGLRSMERPRFPKHIAEFPNGGVQIRLVSPVQQVFQSRDGHPVGERPVTGETAEEREGRKRLPGVLNGSGHEVVASVETHD